MAIVGGVIATFASCGAATPLLGLGVVLGGAAVSSYNYTKTLDCDRTIGRERSWLQFYVERTAREFQGAAADAVEVTAGGEIVMGLTGTAALIAAMVQSGKGGESKEGVEVKENNSKTLDDILEDAEQGRTTKGKTTQYVKSGTYEQASEDFDALNPSNVKEIDTKFGSGKTGTLSDGRTITARPGSSEGCPTLEIRSSNGRGIEIRYGK
ncbi:MAG: hypothetical protein NC307_14825 [Roseburia sp.]|nr:hypothetical protein [Roseburia sp.]